MSGAPPTPQPQGMDRADEPPKKEPKEDDGPKSVRPHLLLGVDHPTALNFFRFELGLAKESVSTEHLKGHGEVSTCTKCCSGITGSSVNSDKEKGACDHCTSCYNTLTCVKTSDEDKLANFTSSYVSEAYKFKKGMNISVTKWEPDWDAGMKKRGNDAYGKGDTFIGQVYPKRACMRASNAPLDRKHQHLAHRVYTRADYTVYDVNVLVRQWLKDQGAKDSSVAEVLRDKKEHFQKKWKVHFQNKATEKEVSKGLIMSSAKSKTVDKNATYGADMMGNPICNVAKAHVFLSHVQAETPAQMLDAMDQICHRREAAKNLKKPMGSSIKVWVDVFCLRQNAKNEFNPKEIKLLLKDIGNTVSYFDGPAFDDTYLTRSFCILELFSTINSGSNLMVQLPAKGKYTYPKLPPKFCCGKLPCCCWCCCYSIPDYKIDCMSAQTRDPEGKKLVDKFIEDGVGAKAVNEQTQEAMEKIANRLAWKWLCITCCAPCGRWGVACDDYNLRCINCCLCCKV